MIRFATQQALKFAVTLANDGVCFVAFVVVVYGCVFATTFEADDLVTRDFAFGPVGAVSHFPTSAALKCLWDITHRDESGTGAEHGYSVVDCRLGDFVGEVFIREDYDATVPLERKRVTEPIGWDTNRG